MCVAPVSGPAQWASKWRNQTNRPHFLPFAGNATPRKRFDALQSSFAKRVASKRRDRRERENQKARKRSETASEKASKQPGTAEQKAGKSEAIRMHQHTNTHTNQHTHANMDRNTRTHPLMHQVQSASALSTHPRRAQAVLQAQALVCTQHHTRV